MTITLSSEQLMDVYQSLCGLNKLYKIPFSAQEIYNYLDSFSLCVNSRKYRLVFYIIPTNHLNKESSKREPYIFIVSFQASSFVHSPYINLRRITYLGTPSAHLKDRKYSFSEQEFVKYFNTTKWVILKWTQEKI